MKCLQNKSHLFSTNVHVWCCYFQSSIIWYLPRELLILIFLRGAWFTFSRFIFSLQQLSVEEAFRLCRYDWMRSALEEFLRASPGGRKHRMMEDAATPIPEVTVRPEFIDAQCFNESDKRLVTVSWSLEDYLLPTWSLIVLVAWFFLLSTISGSTFVCVSDCRTGLVMAAWLHVTLLTTARTLFHFSFSCWKTLMDGMALLDEWICVQSYECPHGDTKVPIWIFTNWVQVTLFMSNWGFRCLDNWKRVVFFAISSYG